MERGAVTPTHSRRRYELRAIAPLIQWLAISSVFALAAAVQGLGTLDSLLAASHYFPAVVVGLFAARMFVHRVCATVIKRMVLWLTVLAGAFLFARTIVT